MRTLCIDIGGSHLKAIVLDADGAPVTERFHVDTPRPAVPEAVLHGIEGFIKQAGEFDRVSAGFPGVVVDGITKTAPNLDSTWAGFPLAATLAEKTGKPSRVANDCGVQGLGVIESKGVEMVLTFGTGMGCALYVDGIYVPNIELGHHPLKKGQTYEERIRLSELQRIGKKRWNKRVLQIIATVEPIFNYRRLYLGGGNARLIPPENMPSNVTIIDNVAGLLGGIRLWS